MGIIIKKASEEDLIYSEQLAKEYQISAQMRGTGIATRKPEYIGKKMTNGNAIIALDGKELAGFCYIEIFSSEQYVSNSGLIVIPKFRGLGLSKQIKKAAFNHARDKYPAAKIFGITTSSIVMKINSDLGYKPVPLSELTTDDEFWNSCMSCANFDILTRHNRRMCLCTGMLAASKNEMEHDLSELIINKNT
ncbi:GNAT family N-acetyltransferase [Portibacter lacus]|uniref:N-acetyltransferase n=1 Tax=Portibacter lacus TaxID=1099794 RepID=A0AA37WEM1_9BACT|nr:GNAT family N-acetyltransferase [Portibacter lacus]GLR17547.1 N-acetyltransferase [Portibacter lacus]